MREFLERVLALKITDQERISYANDVRNIFSEDVSSRKPTRVAAVLAFLFHLLLLFVVFPSFGATVLEPVRDVIMIKQLARPAQLAGAEGAPEAAPPKPKPVVPDPKPEFIPIPDPTPNAPEPIRKEEVEVPRIIEQLDVDLSIGDIDAPPGPPSRGGEGSGALGGRGLGTQAGAGTGTGDGSGPYRVGGGVSNPIVLVQTTPSYTDEAIKGKVQGVVFLQAVIRKDGRADSFKVVRGLGYGLEESAIKEIAANWRFKPGMRNGRAVDVLATIEVTFTLR
jgi:TonB family protein